MRRPKRAAQEALDVEPDVAVQETGGVGAAFGQPTRPLLRSLVITESRRSRRMPGTEAGPPAARESESSVLV